jgi:hypothetical protein
MRTIPKDAIHVYHVLYHRNGVSSEGFYTVYFRYINESDNFNGHLIGILTDLETNGNGKTLHETNGYCFIITPSEPERCWRGDVFEPYLRGAIKNYPKGKQGFGFDNQKPEIKYKVRYGSKKLKVPLKKSEIPQPKPTRFNQIDIV